MNFSKMTYNEIILKCSLMINNSISDKVIAPIVASFGYTAEKLAAGKKILNETTDLFESQKNEYGEQNQAQNDFSQKKAIANKEYMIMIRLARIAFKNNVQAITTLDLNGRRSSTISGWIQQSRNFYKAILGNDQWKAAMAEFGQSEAKLSAGLAKIDDVSALIETVKKETGDAQNATEQRNIKLEDLSEWINDYEQVARIALEDQAQLLEKLGIVVKN